MNKFKLYRQMKNEYAYSLFKNNQSFEKVRALVIRDGKILLVHKIQSNKYALPGGGVESGENIEIAVVRESYEEAKARVKLRSIVGILNYNVNMTFKGETFKSTRIEYYCLCDFLGFVKQKKYFGLNGEFFEKVEVVWHSIDNLETTNLSEYVVSKVKKIAKMQNLNSEKEKSSEQSKGKETNKTTKKKGRFFFKHKQKANKKSQNQSGEETEKENKQQFNQSKRNENKIIAQNKFGKKIKQFKIKKAKETKRQKKCEDDKSLFKNDIKKEKKEIKENLKHAKKENKENLKNIKKENKKISKNFKKENKNYFKKKSQENQKSKTNNLAKED